MNESDTAEVADMSKSRRYLKSLSYQFLTCGILALIFAFLFTIGDLSFFFYAAKGLYNHGEILAQEDLFGVYELGTIIDDSLAWGTDQEVYINSRNTLDNE